MGKRRSHSAAEAAVGVRGGAVAELPVEMLSVSVSARARAVWEPPRPAAVRRPRPWALAVHARGELEPRVDAREVHAPHAAELHDELRAVHGGAARHGATPTNYFDYFDLDN